MRYIFANYNFRPEWVLGETSDYFIFDRSDSDEYLKYFPQERIQKTANVGNVDYDKLGFLIEFYNDLPEIFLWGKSNLFKYISEEEFKLLKYNSGFTPLLTQSHKTYSDKNGQVCYYENGMYYERNDSWYVGQMESRIPTYGEFAEYLNLPNPNYLPFAPGGNYILTRERVHRYSKDFYQKMRDLLDYCQLPAEAHMCERTYFTLWQ